MSVPLGRPDQESNSTGRLTLLVLRLATIAETCKSDWLRLLLLLILQQIRGPLPNVTSFSILKMQCFLHISVKIIFLTVYITLKFSYVLIPNHAPKSLLSPEHLDVAPVKNISDQQQNINCTSFFQFKTSGGKGRFPPLINDLPQTQSRDILSQIWFLFCGMEVRAIEEQDLHKLNCSTL